MDFASLHYDASQLLGRPLLKPAFESYQTKRKIVFIDKFVSLEKLYRAECQIVNHINRLRLNAKPLGFAMSDEGFDDKQKLIPEMIENNSVSIITGVPGSGKSHSVAQIIKKLVENGVTRILVVAPTGKAAKRDSEFIQEAIPDIEIPCMTIHRALGGRIESDAEEGIPEDKSANQSGPRQVRF